MTYQVDQLVKIVSVSGRSGLTAHKVLIGSVGRILQIRGNNHYTRFEFDQVENIALYMKYPSSVKNSDPLIYYFGEEELEPYILDVNFLD